MNNEYKLSELELFNNDEIVINARTAIKNKIIEALEQKDFSEILKEWYVPLEIFIKSNSNFDYLEYNEHKYEYASWNQENRNIYNYTNVPEDLKNKMISKINAEEILNTYLKNLNIFLNNNNLGLELEKKIFNVSKLIEEQIIKYMEDNSINEYSLLDLLKDVQYRWDSAFYNHLYLNMHEIISNYAKKNELRFTENGEIINYDNEKSDTYHF